MPTLPWSVGPTARESFAEERANDISAIRLAGPRRFWRTIVVAGLLLIGVRLGVVDASVQVVVLGFCVAIGLNWALCTLGARERSYRLWFRYAFAGFDTLLISGLVLLTGWPVLAMAYLMVIAPASFDRSRWLGVFATVTSMVGFLTASYGHAAMHPAVSTPVLPVALAAALLTIVAQYVTRLPSDLVARIRRTRECVAKIERGDLRARSDARGHDEFGFLERGLNRMLDELALLIETVQREAEELATVAIQVHDSASVLHQRAGEVAAGATALSDGLRQQRVLTVEGVRAGRQASSTADSTRDTAHRTARDAHEVDLIASKSRAAIERAAHTLIRVSEDVSASAARVQRLAPASDQVGDFVTSVSRIARQTNLLALNAAIEAARAGDQGVGFAVVADEIRKLAGESAVAAKAIARTVLRVRDDIGAAVLSMDHTVQEVSDTGSIAREATLALTAMVTGIARIAEQSDSVALLAQSQTVLTADAVSAFDALDESALRAADRARDAAAATAAQRTSIENLSRSAAQLSQAAARMRAVAQRHTSEFAVVDLPPVRSSPESTVTSREMDVTASPAVAREVRSIAA